MSNGKAASSKLAIQTKVIQGALKTLNRGSDESVIKLAEVFKAFAPPTERGRLSGLQKLIRNNHPGVKVMRRIFSELDDNCQAKIIRNLVLEGVLNRQVRRDKILDAGGAPLFTLLMSPTMRCNLQCEGCYASNYTRDHDLPFEIMDRVVSEAEQWSTAFISVLGGEPFVRPDLLELFERHKNHMYFNVFTNATLIDDELAGRLRDLGNVLVQVSIEGFAGHTDERRGQGTFERAIRGAEILRKHRVPFGYSVCVTTHNIEEVVSDEFVDMMIGKGALIGWYFLYMPTCGDTDLSLMPTPEQRNFLRERRREIRNTKPIFVIDFWNDAPYVDGCIAGRDYCHITANGDVEPCIFTHFSQMNIKDHSLKEVAECEFFRELRARQPYSDNLLLPCMLIDHPSVAEEVVELCHCRPTHPGATTIFDEIKGDLADYSRRVHEVYEPVWNEEMAIVEKDLADHRTDDMKKRRRKTVTAAPSK